ncbi:hypothetical protein Acsp03_55030 [Actinomadura sp. NBRC 104412]|nr:hypothetical protein Acsp03_55030 [Actinomadura sp. NBRC 104412]
MRFKRIARCRKSRQSGPGRSPVRPWQPSGKARTGLGTAPRPGRTRSREQWFRWEPWGWSRAPHRAGAMVARERQGDGVSGNDTPLAMEKTTSGRSCVVSRGIAGGFSGIVYVG